MYSARFYSEPVDIHTPFRMLPRYVGSCAVRILGNNAHLTRLVFMGAEGAGVKVGHRFENHHHLDLCLRLLEAEPQLETATFERHKGAVEVSRTVRLLDRVRFLTRCDTKEV
jgi:hypothetical protein